MGSGVGMGVTVSVGDGSGVCVGGFIGGMVADAEGVVGTGVGTDGSDVGFSVTGTSGLL